MAFLRLTYGAFNLDFVRSIIRQQNGSFWIYEFPSGIESISNPDDIRIVEEFLKAGNAPTPAADGRSWRHEKPML